MLPSKSAGTWIIVECFPTDLTSRAQVSTQSEEHEAARNFHLSFFAGASEERGRAGRVSLQVRGPIGIGKKAQTTVSVRGAELSASSRACNYTHQLQHCSFTQEREVAQSGWYIMLYSTFAPCQCTSSRHCRLRLISVTCQRSGANCTRTTLCPLEACRQLQASSEPSARTAQRRGGC